MNEPMPTITAARPKWHALTLQFPREDIRGFFSGNDPEEGVTYGIRVGEVRERDDGSVSVAMNFVAIPA